MKIGVLLTGISTGVRNRNWKNTADSIVEKVIKCWSPNLVNTYLTTYHHPEIDDLIQYYNPTKYQILNYEGSDQRLTYAKSLEMLVDQDLDIIISTRFDIEFYTQLSDYNINFSKFNFLFKEGGSWWSKHQFTTDNLFIFPKSMLSDTIKVVHELYTNPYRPHPDLHPLYNRLTSIIGTDSTHFITEGLELSSNNTQYKLVRT